MELKTKIKIIVAFMLVSVGVALLPALVWWNLSAGCFGIVYLLYVEVREMEK